MGSATTFSKTDCGESPRTVNKDHRAQRPHGNSGCGFHGNWGLSSCHWATWETQQTWPHPLEMCYLSEEQNIRVWYAFIGTHMTDQMQLNNAVWPMTLFDKQKLPCPPLIYLGHLNEQHDWKRMKAMVVEIRFFKHTFSPYFPSALLKITENNTFPLLQHVYTTTKLAFALVNTVFKEYVTAVILKLSFLLLFLHMFLHFKSWNLWVLLDI